jgi:hypothetical protein
VYVTCLSSNHSSASSDYYFISPSAAPPKINTELQNSSCMTDEKMTFTVEVEGMPVPEVKWYV